MRVITAAPDEKSSLTPTEKALIRMFRQLDDEVQDFQLEYLRALSRDSTLLRPVKPVLRLVQGGAA